MVPGFFWEGPVEDTKEEAQNEGIRFTTKFRGIDIKMKSNAQRKQFILYVGWGRSKIHAVRYVKHLIQVW